MFSIVVDVGGVAKLIENLDYHSSPGFDSVNGKFLKNTSAYSSIILAKIFQQSLDTCKYFTYTMEDWEGGSSSQVRQQSHGH